MADAPKQNLQTTAIIAKLFDLDERRVQQLAKSGVLPAASTRPYKFDLLPTVKAYIKAPAGKGQRQGNQDRRHRES